jgi:hypothetical protein
MNRMVFWFLFGVFCTMSMIMVAFGLLFIRDVYLHRAEVSFGSVILGILLLMAGGGLFATTIAETVRQLCERHQR